MKKSVLIPVVAIIILSVGAAIFVFSSKADAPAKTSSVSTATKSTSSADTTKTTQQNPATPATATTHSISIDNFAFSETSTTVKVGTAVTWTNKDSMAHTVTETDGQTGPDSGNLDTGKSYTFTYTKAGTYKYHCAYHSSMTGTIIVTE